MKKIMLLMILTFLLIGCENNTLNNTENNVVNETGNTEDITEDNQIPAEVQGIDDSETDTNEVIEMKTVEDVVGTWTCVVNQEYFDDVYSLVLFDDMTFVTNDYQTLDKETYEYHLFTGHWELENNKIVFSYQNAINESTNEIELNEEAIELKTIGVVNENLKIGDKVYSYYVMNNLQTRDHNDMTGYWKRTNVHRSHGGDINVIYQDDNFIYFTAFLMYYAHTGYVSGVATFDSENTAMYIHTEMIGENEELTHIKFKLEDDVMSVESNNNMGLPFGMNVYIDGEYTQDEAVYTNQNVLIETFETEERLNYMKSFLGEESWSFLKMVMEYGGQFQSDELTFSGFIMGLGSGADFIMTDDNKIYYLSYGEGPGNVFYTNDLNCKDKIPNILADDIRDPLSMKFVFRDEEEVVVDNYVWMRGHYNQPKSMLSESTVFWDRNQGDEYLEIHVKGKVENLSLVKLYYDEETGTFRVVEIIERMDEFENGTLVVDAYHSEGIPSVAIRFEDLNGEIHYYYLQDDSQLGEIYSVNQQLFSIPKVKTAETVDIYKANGDYLRVPVLNDDGFELEDFVPSGWVLMDSIELDFNRDGFKDYVGVLEIKDFDFIRHEMYEYPRILFSVKGTNSGYELSFQDINLVRNRGEGGVFGDPYLPLTTDGHSFEINAYGGSAWRWSERSQFSYQDEWYLSEYESTYGYGPYTTNYVYYDYLKGIGIKSYNSDDFENRDEVTTSYELTYEIELDEPPVLEKVSANWMWVDSRLEEIIVEDIEFAEDVDSSHYDIEELKNLLKSSSYIKEITAANIIYRLTTDDSYESVIVFDRLSGVATVVLETEYLKDAFDSRLDELYIHENTLYYSENHIERYSYTKSDGSTEEAMDTMSTGLYSINLDGTNKNELAVFQNEPNQEGYYPYYSIGFEFHKNIIYLYEYRNGIYKYYKLNINGDNLELLGVV